MCELCWNADKKEKEHPFCPQTHKPYVITLDQLKEEVIKRWISTGTLHFRIHKKVIYNPPKQSCVYEATYRNDSGRLLEKARLSIQFI